MQQPLIFSAFWGLNGWWWALSPKAGDLRCMCRNGRTRAHLAFWLGWKEPCFVQELQAQIQSSADPSVFWSPGGSDHCDSMWTAPWSWARPRPWTWGLLKISTYHILNHISLLTAGEGLFFNCLKNRILLWRRKGGACQGAGRNALGSLYVSQKSYESCWDPAINVWNPDWEKG